ncbi:tRNA guanosine(34) transglycosylase Tgt [Candidatus Roizmanbacteria bacterium]|nr:tRNA guanosine(34) transglycosylase Tgt [Candidatus Roizmanbacteria bacterium]
MTSFFSVHQRSQKSQARLGTITTSHGKIQTPAFVPVGTKGTIKALTPSLIKDIGVQVSFVNTYHLVTHPGPEIIAKAGGIHTYSKMNIPLMSDSGGFQVFSLAQNSRKAKLRADDSESPLVEKISEDGVKFRSLYDGQLIEFTPEKSMEYQRQIGADLLMAFDECTYYPATHEYAEKALMRTHEWLKRCIAYKKTRHDVFCPPHPKGAQAIDKKHMSSFFHEQYLYGIIQGGTFEDLRVASAKFIAEQDVPGVAIGGVSVGETKEEMREQVKWIVPYLPADKPVHLLGVGQIDDIIDLVKYGIDTFDCVEPTRLARMGVIYSHSNKQIDINKSIFKADLTRVDEKCSCYVCQNFTKSYLHHLFKQREILGYTLATYHNLWVMEKLMENIREMILQGKI